MSRFVLLATAVFLALLLSGELALTLPFAGIGPDIVIIVVAVFSIGERPRTAALVGFGAGLVRDLLLSTPTGLSAFAYALTAYATALVGVSRGAWPLIGTMVAATFFSQVIYGFGAVMLGPQLDASPLPRMVFITTAYNALLSPLLMPLLRRVIPTETAAQAGE